MSDRGQSEEEFEESIRVVKIVGRISRTFIVWRGCKGREKGNKSRRRKRGPDFDRTPPFPIYAAGRFVAVLRISSGRSARLSDLSGGWAPSPCASMPSWIILSRPALGCWRLMILAMLAILGRAHFPCFQLRAGQMSSSWRTNKDARSTCARPTLIRQR
jgi:hypothetical protein